MFIAFYYFNTTTQNIYQGQNIKNDGGILGGYTCLKLYEDKLYALGAIAAHTTPKYRSFV